MTVINNLVLYTDLPRVGGRELKGVASQSGHGEAGGGSPQRHPGELL